MSEPTQDDHQSPDPSRGDPREAGANPGAAAGEEPTLSDGLAFTGEPTAEVPRPPTSPLPPQPGSAWQAGTWPPPPGGHAFGSPPPGASFPPGPPPHPGVPGYPGSGYHGVPPYGQVPGGWSQPAWHGAPSWQWAPAPPGAHRRPGSNSLAIVLAAAVAVAAILGALIGHAVWSSSGSPAGNSSPFGGGIGSPSPNNAAPGSSSGSGGPANAASIAQNVDPGLVDVNTSVSYQGLQGAGTGMVLTPGGEVLTNNHVIEGATKITATDVGNHKTYNATVVGYDRSHDIAVLQLSDASGLQTVSIGDSSKVGTGQGVVAVGNANGSGGTPSYAGGSVSATNQSITASDQVAGTSEQLSNLIETNADIVSGDSGGPLVNSAGQVVGIDTAGSGGFQFQSQGNQGYAIPINTASTTAKQITAGTGSSTVHVGPTAFLGIEVRPSNSGGGNGGGTGGGIGGIGGGNGGGGGPNPANGAAIVNVVPGGPADQAGLQQGDTIVSLDGHGVSSPDALTALMIGQKPGASVQVQYLDSSGQQHGATVTLGTGPPQ